MATVTTPGTSAPSAATTDHDRLADRLSRLRGRAQEVPTWLWTSVGLLALMALSAYLRSRYISYQLWMDEGITTGISLHPLGSIPGVLRYDGNPPLYYMLLHIWMSWFGDSETATHSLSLLFGVLTIPVGGWGAWKVFGRRAGVMAAILFAFNAWLTAYAQETRMYELVALIGTVATVAYVLGFVYRRRAFLFLFGASLTAMLYTHSWGTFFFAGSAIALIPALIASDDRRRFLIDAVITYVIAGGVLPAVGADAALPGRPHRRPLGPPAASRRTDPDLPQPARRRPDHGRARVQRDHRPGTAVHPALPPHP